MAVKRQAPEANPVRGVPFPDLSSVALLRISTQHYVRDILPQSRALWGAGRSLGEYADDHLAVATSAYGRRHVRTVGITVDGQLVSSCKRYERTLRCGATPLSAIGIGAVFTPPDRRGRGYATALLAAVIDAARERGVDVAYLFSDIHPAFYERLGFIRLPSRGIVLRADSLPSRRVDAAGIEGADWPAIARCFDRLDEQRTVALRRTPLAWDWIRIKRMQTATGTQRIDLAIRRRRSVRAYVLATRSPRTDTLVLDEFGYTGEDGFADVLPLIRNAAGDLRRIAGWLPPDVARRALPRGTVKLRKKTVMMIAPLSPAARDAWRKYGAAILADDADRCWSTDHL